MYRLSVPVMNLHLQDRTGRDTILSDLKKAGADRVFLALGSYTKDAAKRKAEMDALCDNVAFFKKEGFEVGAWLWTFMVPGDETFVHMESPTGARSHDEVCPSDAAFRAFAAGYVREVAETGVDLIMYDDDYRYGFLDMGFGCTCPNHRARIEKTLGKKVTGEELRAAVMTGGKNEIRTAFVEANRFYLLNFAREMRTELDKINKNCRFGVCACLSVWDMDGAAAYEISEALAGDTAPFLRLIGAPYWGANGGWGSRIADVVELERMERAWCPDGIEIFSEGDVYPRPRFRVPAAYLEGFDTALRADGSLDGILKYMFDYTSTATYERGYLDRHLRNAQRYREIDELFGGKTPVGVRIYESMRKYENAVIPKRVEDKNDIQNFFFSPAARMISAFGMPSTYHGRGVFGVAFGENARYLSPDEVDGLVLDRRAAEILTERGFDVGYRADLGVELVATEHYLSPDEYVCVNDDFSPVEVHRIETDPRVKLLSRYEVKDGESPASYLYENRDGKRFLVYAFDAHFGPDSLYRTYRRATDIAAAAAWLGEKLPAEAAGENPDLYLLAKEGADGALSVGLWNFSVDEAIAPVVRLGRTYEKITAAETAATLDGDTVTLSDIPPFGFAAFEVR